MVKTMLLALSKLRVPDREQRFASDPERINDLAASITRVGLLNPITVSVDGDGYVIVAGCTRFRACEKAGLSEVPVVVVEADEADRGAMTFAENFFRQNLSPVEQAVAIGEAYQSGAMSIEQIGRAFGHSKDWVTRQIAITQWPDDCLMAIHNGELSVSSASNLAQINDDRYRAFLLSRAVADGASARATAAWLSAWRANRRPEEAVASEPAGPGQPMVPMSPQSPCLMCSKVFPMDALSYVPFCAGCIGRVRSTPAQ